MLLTAKLLHTHTQVNKVYVVNTEEQPDPANDLWRVSNSQLAWQVR